MRILERQQAGTTASSSSSSSRSKSQRLRLRSLSGVTTSSRSCSATPIAETLRISDGSLLARARSVVAKLDFAALTDMSPAKWTWKRDLNEFSLFDGVGTCMLEAPEHHHCLRVRRRKVCGASELLVAGDVNCSIEEVAALLRAKSDASFNTAMKDLHASEFIFGSVAHTIPLPWRTDCEQPADAAAASTMMSSTNLTSSLCEAAADSSRNNYVALKAATFVHSALFTRNEEWCFLESFECSPSGDSLVVSQSSLPAVELGSGVTPAHARVVQLHGISTTFLAERIPRTKSVRLVFHVKFDDRASGGDDDDSGGSEESNAPRHRGGRLEARSKTVSTRLQKFAKNMSRIPEIVRRRRIGAQTLASKSTLAAASNSRCTCCTTSLRLLALLGKRQRCRLCAYNVCDRCCSQEMMETRSGHGATILMCRRCVECVEVCEFAEFNAETHYELRVELEASRTLARKRSAAIKEILQSALDSGNSLGDEASTEAAAAATAVVQHLIRRPRDPVCSGDRLSISELATTSAASSFATTSTSTLALTSTSGSPTSQPLATASSTNTQAATSALLATLNDELERVASQPQRLENCVLANAETRSYPIHVPANPRVSVPDHPVPANEAWRLRVIDASSFLALGEVPELNVICALAAETLQCAISMVTVIDQETEHILSSNSPELHRTRMARNQTFCAHLIMDAKPLLVRHPEADVRFHALDAVVKSGVRFYCGFPLRARDGTVVGSVCCLDFQQRALMQSQYALMDKLAQTASSIVQTKGEAIARFRKAGGSPV